MSPSRLWILSVAIWILSVAILVSAASHHASQILENEDNGSIKTSVFLSPPFYLRAGSVADKNFYDVAFPRGHIALKSFNAEVVDEMGVPVPLHETYLHHWAMLRYDGAQFGNNIIGVKTSGICKNIWQYFGLGSETRRTATWVPGPYGIVVGDPKEVPNGYEERWLLNVHAIDTRGVKDRSGCTECKCDLYNVTKDEFGHSLSENYIGGLRCCYDKTQCRIRDGFNGGGLRKLYLRYTVKWVDWDESIVPVKIYVFDVTDSANASSHERDCKVEYQVDACGPEGIESGRPCVDTKKASFAIPRGGDLIYGVAHQHSGGVGSALYGQDGRLLCSSMPIYGRGEAAGDEDGYIVGMSTCYPKPGSVQIEGGEFLTLESNYSSTKMHTGVMGLFYILVAEPQPHQPKFTRLFYSLTKPWRAVVATYWWAFALVGGTMVVIIFFGISYSQRNGGGYQAL